MFPSSICCFKRNFVKNIVWVFLAWQRAIGRWKGKWKERLIGDFLISWLEKTPSFPFKSPYLLAGEVPWRECPFVVLLLQTSFTRLFSHDCPRWENCKRSGVFQDSREQERKGKQRRGENHPCLTCFYSLPSIVNWRLADFVLWG